MTAADFRRIALSLDGVEEIAHAGLPAFRVGGARFASLASQSAGYGNLTLTLEQQAAFVEDAPEIFLPIPGGFGRMGHTHIRLAAADEDILTGALRTAWKLRIEKSAAGIAIDAVENAGRVMAMVTLVAAPLTAGASLSWLVPEMTSMARVVPSSTKRYSTRSAIGAPFAPPPK